MRSVRMLKSKDTISGHLDPFQFILSPYYFTEVDRLVRRHPRGMLRSGLDF